jgi:hypothetical protein
MLVSRMPPHLAMWPLAASLVAGRNAKPPAGLGNSTINTNNNKPDAGIPLTTSEPRKQTIRRIDES